MHAQMDWLQAADTHCLWAGKNSAHSWIMLRGFVLALASATVAGTQQAAADLQARSCDSMGPHKLHDKHMHAQVNWLRAADAHCLQASQISELLLCPQLDHLAGIALAVACAEAEVSLHIPSRSLPTVRTRPGDLEAYFVTLRFCAILQTQSLYRKMGGGLSSPSLAPLNQVQRL